MGGVDAPVVSDSRHLGQADKQTAIMGSHSRRKHSRQFDRQSGGVLQRLVGA